MVYQRTNPYDGSILATFDEHDDADLDEAVKHAVSGRMGNSGQTCTASKRFIVVESRADRFLDKFAQALGNFSAGDPLNARTTLAPLSLERALATLLEQVDRAVAAGARVIMGGARIDAAGAFMQPTILTDIDAANPAYKEEFFGPVALFFRVADDDAARRIDTGMMFINSAAVTSPELPFGGVKHSGCGRELGRMGIQEFVNKKLVRSGDIAAPV